MQLTGIIPAPALPPRSHRSRHASRVGVHQRVVRLHDRAADARQVRVDVRGKRPRERAEVSHRHTVERCRDLADDLPINRNPPRPEVATLPLSTATSN